MENFVDSFDWEKENDSQYYELLNNKRVEYEWEQWVIEQESKTRLPAVIKVIKPKTKHEIKRNTSTIRGADQERL
jgi:hypothetical protein